VLQVGVQRLSDETDEAQGGVVGVLEHDDARAVGLVGVALQVWIGSVDVRVWGVGSVNVR
jgi:hypothetical protein